MTKKQVGQDMINHGQWSEWHQQMARKTPNDAGYHLSMYGWHHSQYMQLKDQYNKIS